LSWSDRFGERVVVWQRQHGRNNLPWQNTRDPYRIWLSEIMLQQTQVATVLGYYARFLARFADVASLAAATEDDVLRLWQGLGYYSRGRNLHKAAQMVVRDFGGAFPTTPAQLEQLPGVGCSTAAAIAVFAFGARAAILDGNVKRVLARHTALPRTVGNAWEVNLWQTAEARLPQADVERYTQGLMDLGATVCVRRTPRCDACPVATDCVAHLQGKTALIPGPAVRPRRIQKEWRFVALVVDGQVLLERRPGRGVWPALWCLPEWHHDTPPTADDPATLQRARTLEFDHTFTHFKLHAVVHALDLCATPHTLAAGSAWVGLEQLPNYALPRPMARLMPQIFSKM
jgi:A/G-specific adenine glycosylase